MVYRGHIGALEVPPETDRRNHRIGQTRAGIGIDFGALNPVVRADRKQDLEAIEAAEQLLRRDDADAAAVNTGS